MVKDKEKRFKITVSWKR